MSALETLKHLQLEARKNRDSDLIELYSYLLGQVNLKHKNATDDEVWNRINEFI